MKKGICVILVWMVFVLSMGVQAMAMPRQVPEIGSVVGEVLKTDIVARINDYDIASYNVNGYTYIVAEDLRDYGFEVNYDETSRLLSVNRDISKTSVTKSYIKPYVYNSRVGEFVCDILYTDIKTTLEGSEVEGYNIDGQMIIRFDELEIYGEVLYEDNKREISVTLPGMNSNPDVIENRFESILDSLNEQERTEINKFLSNFSEAFFEKIYLNDAESKVSFAFIHSFINAPELLHSDYEKGTSKIAVSSVDNILNRFFGETISRETYESFENYSYKDGCFESRIGYGETYATFTVAKEVYPVGNGEFVVFFDEYFDTSVDAGCCIEDKSVYSLTSQQAENNSRFIYSGFGSAIIRSKIYNGENTYELVNYDSNYDPNYDYCR